MPPKELSVVTLRQSFYRDGFYKVFLAFVVLCTAIGLLVGISLHIFFTKPAPVTFSVDNEKRVVAPVPLDQMYLNLPDLVQWVSDVLPDVFTYDFVNYQRKLKNSERYFTASGWQKFQTTLNNYANSVTVQNTKLFINADAGGAPFVLSQGVLEGRYAWWMQMPLDVNYINFEKAYTRSLVVQVLVVRVPTLDNLYGISIENIVISKVDGEQTSAAK